MQQFKNLDYVPSEEIMRHTHYMQYYTHWQYIPYEDLEEVKQ